VWVGTLGGLVEIWIDETTSIAERIKVHTGESGLPGNQVWDLLRDRKGRLWVATEGGLCQFDPDKAECTRTIDTDDGLASNDLITLRESSRGEILTSTTEGLSIITLDNGKVAIRNVSADDGLAGSIVYGIGEDRFGRLWVGSEQGLSSIDGDRIAAYTMKDGLPHDEIHVIHSSRDGTMWVGTNGGGLVSFDPPEPGSGVRPRFETWGPDIGVHPAIAAITEDERGRLWLATTRGAILFDPSLARQKRPAITALVDRASGLVGNEVNDFDFDSRGNLWIAVAGGVTQYDPEIAAKPVSAPRATIESVVTPESLWLARFSKPEVEREKRIWLDGGRIEIPPRSASIRIDYRSLTLREPKRVTYQVRLVGFRNEWSDATSATFKEYTNLFPGRYTFEVRASSRPGEWGEPERLEMRLLPAWWQRPAFIAASVLGLIVLLGIGYRARTYAINRRNLELEKAVDERTEDLRRYARALEEHSHALDRANFRIREADRVKSEFLANMSHELRTPLNSIIGFSDVLVPALEPRIDQRQHRFLRNIQTSGRYLLLLINNLLDLSKIEAGRADVVAENARVDEIVETTCEIVQGYAADRRIEVHATVPDSMPEVRIDVAKFRQVLLNLLSNAVKFSASGDVVNVEVRSVPRESSALGVDAFELVVRDHGPGISAIDREAIFEEFRQVGGGSSHPGGTGLGLALVRRFVELLGGTIRVESAPGAGSIFTVELPMIYQDDTATTRGESASDSAQPRVIVLSGSDKLFADLASTMEREGFAPVRARTLDEAGQMASRVDPVAVILSIDLQITEEWNVLGAIGGDPRLATLTVGICLTSDGNVVAAIGADTLILHPVRVERAREHIASYAAPQEGSPIFVEDEAGRLSALARAICGESFVKRCATAPAEAVSLATETGAGVIVVDLASAAMGGFDAVRRLQLARQTRHTPIVVVAPLALDDEIHHGFASASFDDVAAPLDELALTMHELLRRRSARAVRLAAASLA
jgi:signal transduction histidine kinase/DNA-binding response OmpR family regulator/sugar lactone lactonase YvrE